jgi:hypothetical protein
MTPCDCCGNTYDKAFEVRMASGQTYTFDSLECAVHKLAPACSHCGCRIIGHGVEGEGAMYCCAYCARNEGLHGVQDRAQ